MTLDGEKIMADIAVFIVSDRVRQGRERRALRVFAASREYFEGLEKEKAIENFEVGVAGPAAPADIGAFWVVRGTEDQLRAVRESKEFRRLMVRASKTSGSSGSSLAGNHSLRCSKNSKRK
jgi:hypothetical protein